MLAKKIFISAILILLLGMLFFSHLLFDQLRNKKEAKFLIDQSIEILKLQTKHTYSGFPRKWNIKTNEYVDIDTISSPRFIQYWNLSYLTYGSIALNYMTNVIDAFYTSSMNQDIPWYYDFNQKGAKKDFPLPAFVIGDTLMGLGHVYEMSGNEIYKERAENLGKRSIDLFLDPDTNLIRDQINFDLSPKYDTKSEMGRETLLIDSWLYLFDILGDRYYLDNADKAITALWNLRNPQTNLISEVYEASTSAQENQTHAGTIGEFSETIYYAWFLTKDNKYLSILKTLMDTQIKFFWNEQLNRFIDTVNTENGSVIDFGYHAVRLEPNIYSLIRLYSITGDKQLLDLAQKSIDTYRKHGFINGLPVVELDKNNKPVSATTQTGAIYPYIKSAAMLSVFRGEKYLDDAIKVSHRSVELLKRKYGYVSALDLLTGQDVSTDYDLGGSMWLQDEGFAVLASILIFYPQADTMLPSKTSIISIAENSIIRGFKPDIKTNSFTGYISNPQTGSHVCINLPSSYEISFASSSSRFIKYGDCQFFLNSIPGNIEFTVKYKYEI